MIRFQVDWGDKTAAQEVVRLDLLGDRRLVFGPDGVTHFTREIDPLPLPWIVTTNRPLAYRDIRWVGTVRKKPWWALVAAVLFLPLGLFWMAISFGDWGAFGFGAFVFLMLGVLPLGLFLRGRLFLAIASDFEVIGVPMDREKRQVRRALALLRQYCPGDVRWDVPLAAGDSEK